MAKKRTKKSDVEQTASALPTLDDASPPDPVAPLRAVEPESVVASVDITKDGPVVTVATSMTSKVVSISAPFLDGVEGYCRQRVDVSLTRDQAKALKSLQHGLESKNEKLSNGRFVSAPGHAITWLLENMK